MSVESPRAPDLEAERSDLQATFGTLIPPPPTVRMELFDGTIIMGPSPLELHRDLLHDLYELFVHASRPENSIAQFSSVAIELPNGKRFAPALWVIADKNFGDDRSWWQATPDEVHLVVEVAPTDDLAERYRCGVRTLTYASNLFRLLLVIDRLHRHVTLFSNPQDGRYQSRTRVRYGGEIPFPEPFDGALDTSIFDW